MKTIRVENLVKTFRVPVPRPGLSGALLNLVSRQHRVMRAIDDISFSIAPGDCVGYVGPNGAGKSTTVKILSGILTPDAGVVEVLGRVPWKERIEHVRRIGV